MRNQFFFTRTEGDKTFRDSFNMNKVIRTVQVDDNTLIVLRSVSKESQRTLVVG